MMGLRGIQLLANHEAFVNRFVNACEADDRIVAAFLGGSNVKGKADQYSDIDVCIITDDNAYEDFFNKRESFLRSLGELVFLEDFGIPNIAFFIFEDGTEGELYFGSESRLAHIHSGPFRVLVDKKNILAEAVFPDDKTDPSHQTEELRRNIFGFWHEMSHFITSDMGVGEEPYFKIEYAIDVEKLSPLETTFGPMEKDAMLQSVRVIVQFYMEIAPSLSPTHGISYPQGLETVMLERLEKLSKQRMT